MLFKRRALMAGATFLLAAATGHVMQRGETLSARLHGETVSPAQEPAPPAVEQESKANVVPPAAPAAPVLVAADLVSQSAVVMPALAFAPGPVRQFSLVAATTAPDKIDVAQPAGNVEPAETVEPVDGKAKAVNILGISCGEATMTLGATSPALLRMSLDAPCHPEEAVIVRHSGLSVAAMTDKAGSLEVLIPAVEEPAVVTVEFASGDSLSENRLVPELSGLSRFAVQWQGVDGFQLSAFENSATADDFAHVRGEAPRDRASEGGGFLLTLGQADMAEPMQARVYSAPKDLAVEALEIAAPVTTGNCGREFNGEIVRISPDRKLVVERIGIAMPDCAAVGEFVVLRLAPHQDGPISLASLGE